MSDNADTWTEAAKHPLAGRALRLCQSKKSYRVHRWWDYAKVDWTGAPFNTGEKVWVGKTWTITKPAGQYTVTCWKSGTTANLSVRWIRMNSPILFCSLRRLWKKVVVNLAFPCYDKAPPCWIGVDLQASQLPRLIGGAFSITMQKWLYLLRSNLMQHQPRSAWQIWQWAKFHLQLLSHSRWHLRRCKSKTKETWVAYLVIQQHGPKARLELYPQRKIIHELLFCAKIKLQQVQAILHQANSIIYQCSNVVGLDHPRHLKQQ